MDILSKAQSEAIVSIAVEQLGFLRDNEIWGAGLLATFIEDGSNYRPGEFSVAGPIRIFSYRDALQKAKLVLIRPDGESPVDRALIIPTEGTLLTDEQIAQANGALRALFE